MTFEAMIKKINWKNRRTYIIFLLKIALGVEKKKTLFKHLKNVGNFYFLKL